MKIVRNIILLLLVTSSFWLLAGCQHDDLPQTVVGEPAFELNVNILGETQTVSLDEEGRLTANASMESPDGTVSLLISKGTQLLDKDKRPLQSIILTAADSLPLPPENTQIMGSVYKLGPEGSTANPLLRFTLSYNLEELPAGVSEANIYIAPYDEITGWGKWAYKSVDTNNKRVTTQVSGFGRFAVLAPMAPVPSQANPVAPAQTSWPVSLQEALLNGKPTLAEFGASTCIPCKQMKPILEQLALDYEGKLNVVIVEVHEQMELTRYYRIMTIPTQIVFDGNGNELTRHIGLWPEAQIITQLGKMGIE